jgi:hypothetical protein
VWKLHSACRNYTLRVEIALCIYKSHSCVLKSHFAFKKITFVRVFITQEWFLHAECGFNTYECHNQFRECHNHTHMCQNYTLRVEITLVRIEITVVSVVITFVRFNIRLCVEITLFVWKSHSAYINHTCACWNHTLRSEITFVRVFIIKMILKVISTRFSHVWVP